MRADMLMMLASVASLGAAVAYVACTPAPMPAAQAEAAYGAELMTCVESANTLAESKACRAKVKERWGLKDGGAE